jgi:hypothetical protein
MLGGPPPALLISVKGRAASGGILAGKETSMKTDRLQAQARRAVMRGSRVQDEMRDLTVKALTLRKLDRAEMRKVAGEVMSAVREAAAVKGPRAKDVIAQAAAGVEQALGHAARALKVSNRLAAGVSIAAASGAMMARVASGVLAGIADSLARTGKPRRR